MNNPSKLARPTVNGASEGYQIPAMPTPEKINLQGNSLKLSEDDKKVRIGYYIVWSLVFFGIWMPLTAGNILVALPLAAMSVTIGSFIDSSDRKKRNRGG
jgi:hypothetical protein